MPAPRSQDVLIRAARMYYLDGKSQGEIAKALGVSRSSVSRTLLSARERGIVEIRIHQDRSLTRDAELEAALMERFSLQSAQVVVRPPGRTAVDIVGEMAARIFEKVVPGLSRFGLSWGETIASFTDHVQVEPVYPRLELCPLAGGAPTMQPTGASGHVALDTLARRCGALAYRFDSPAVVESEVTWKALNQESGVIQALERAQRCEVALVGIGRLGVHSSSRVIRAMRLSPEEEQTFMAQNPVGDLCGHFFDIEGRPLGLPSSNRVVGLTLEQLDTIPSVVGIAAGMEKALGALGALRTGVLTQFIGDEELATAVLRAADSPNPGQ
ncbi:helix-turn-helix domain-containing protein [Tessaracoccus sp. SD287]|uniref:sugar-binding transcriptional regulator n=1 Tax=Tessaracoccus sp. SD287 TaxID=2782008 RepID=UPI001A96CF85|nr:helix-turn-helix domain-containing protein [Tessaracoccus sp. SD287]